MTVNSKDTKIYKILKYMFDNNTWNTPKYLSIKISDENKEDFKPNTIQAILSRLYRHEMIKRKKANNRIFYKISTSGINKVDLLNGNENNDKKPEPKHIIQQIPEVHELIKIVDDNSKLKSCIHELTQNGVSLEEIQKTCCAALSKKLDAISKINNELEFLKKNKFHILDEYSNMKEEIKHLNEIINNR